MRLPPLEKSRSIHLMIHRLLMVVFLASVAVTAQAADPGTREKEIIAAAEKLRPRLIETRRDFHMHPELSNREERTARVIAEKLKAFGLDEIKTNVARHGIVALLKGTKPGPVVAVRADIDALPINEVRDVPYRSKITNVMHACGHDVHAAVQLGVAEVLSKMRDQIPGTVKFIFQPAEEGPPVGEEGGAPLMIKEGALENPRPLAIFGLHTTTEVPAGKIGYRAGSAQAAADMFDIVIKGKMSHAARPHAGIDSVVVAAECITSMQSIKSRRVDPFEPVILTVGTIHGGNRRNIIAPDVKLEGTLRTLSEESRARMKELMHATLSGVTSAYGATYDMQMNEATVVVYNDPALVKQTLPVMRRVVGDDNVVEVPQRMGAEDFSYFQKVVPGFYYRLGSGNPAKGITAEAHTPDFDVDEECIVVGVKVMANVLVDFLAQHAESASK
jgi:amidohydrolase